MTTIRSHISTNPSESEGEDYTSVHCPSCAEKLSIHQPDERLPERLLGTCRTCLAWFLLDGNGAITFHLPEAESLKWKGSGP